MMMFRARGHESAADIPGGGKASRACLVLAGALVLLVSAQPLFAETSAEKRKSVAAELERVQTELAQAQTNLAEQAKELWKRQHNLEYGNPECAKLREDIVALEKQLMEKRRQLDTQMAMEPEMKEIRKLRQELFEKIQRLKDDERLLMNEIMALDRGADLTGPLP